MDKGKEGVKGIGGMLKAELAPAVDAPELAQRERNARKMQQARYQKDFKDAMQAFQDVRGRGRGREGGACPEGAGEAAADTLPLALCVPPSLPHAQVANAGADAQRRHPKPVGTGVTVDATQAAAAAGGGKAGKKGKATDPAEDDAL